MECNKDEAIRAKGIAERKMGDNDFVGAHRIAIKAQRLYPELNSISQMICVCDVHCSAENKNFGNDKDWYGILRVEQSADEVSIKKQYRKLALLLHPDKNKFAGAEAAFILIGEAQKVLLDRAKRSSFDTRYTRFCHNTTPNPPQENKNPNNVRPPSDQNKTTKNASSHVEKQPEQQAPSGQNNMKPPSGQNNTTKSASSHVKKQPQEKPPSGHNNMKPPSGQNKTTTTNVKKQSQQQASSSQNNARPPSGQNNATKNTSSHAKKQPQQQGDCRGKETFSTVCPFCATEYRYFKYALNTNLLCQVCRMNFTAYAMCAESTIPKNNGNKTANFARAGVPNAKRTAACPRGVPNQGQFQGNSHQRKPIVDSFAKYCQKTNELNMRTKKISETTSGESKKPAVESSRRPESKSGTGSKDDAVGKRGGAIAGSRCGDDSSSRQRSSKRFKGKS